jgi:hypothetical protein
VIRSLRNMFRYFRRTISSESRHVGSRRYKQDIPSTILRLRANRKLFQAGSPLQAQYPHMSGLRVNQELASGFLPVPQIHPFGRSSITCTFE